MTDLQKFFQYSTAFEFAYATDSWESLAELFDPAAKHECLDAGPLTFDDHGRDAVVRGFRSVLHAVDRRFDVRIPEITRGPEVRGDGIWMRFRLTLRHPGLPDLVLEGEHLTTYRDGLITSIVETLQPGQGQEAARYFVHHEVELRAPGSPFVAPARSSDQSELELAVKRSLVRAYGAAKSRQDIGAALSICHESFRLETISFGLEAKDRAEAELHLQVFFGAFPDYRVTMDSLADDGSSISCWGTAYVTFAGEFLGLAPTGREAQVPFACVFDFQDGLLGRERFFFDLAVLCRQVGVSIDAADQALESVRGDVV